MGLSKVKRGCQLAKGKKKLQTQKRGVKQQKQNKKNYTLHAPLLKGPAGGQVSPFLLIPCTQRKISSSAPISSHPISSGSEAHSEPSADSSSAPSAQDLRKEDLIRENLHLRKGDLAQGQSVPEVRNCFVRVVTAVRAGACRRPSCRCSSPPFVPVLIAALRAGACCRRGVITVSPTPTAEKNKKKTLFSAMPP